MDLESAFSDLPVLATERLTLRRMSPRDLADVYAYGRDPEVSKFTLWDAHRSIDEARLFVNDVIHAYERGEPNPWVIEVNALKRVIGTVGLGDLHPQHGRCEVGYVLGKAYWGKGYATEALRAVLRFCFADLRMNRVEGKCFPENVASGRVMEKAGMQFEGLLREYLFAKGTFQHVRLYAALARDYDEPLAEP